MEGLDLNQLEPVDDPALIAQLEQPQSAINKGEGGTAPAYSQVAMDAFDRAIASANRLRTHPGYGAAVGSGFDPQSWGSWNPFGGASAGKDGEVIPQLPLAGTPARDFVAELGAMRAQVFLPMVQSLKGMGALSNAEGQKLTDAIGALDPGMSESAFRSSLDRIIGDLTQYRNRGAPKDGGQAGTAAAPSAATAAAGTGDIGFSGNAPTPPDNPLNPAQQAAYDAWHAANPKATPEQLVAFVGTLVPGSEMSIENARQIIAGRDAAGMVAPGSSATSGLTAEEQAEVDRRVAEASGVERVGAGMADTVTMGTSDKIIAAGRDLAGKGEYDRELLKANAVTDQIADESPWLYHGGQVAGGFALPAFAARTPAQLAKVAAAYGGAYGAGSSDSLAEVPGNAITGTALGGATGWAGGKLVQKLEQRAARKAAEAGTDAAEETAETAADRYARAQKFGLDVSVGDARGMGAKAIERTLDVQPGSAGVMNKSRERLGEQITDAVEGVAGTFGPSTSYEGMGRAAQSGVKKWQGKFEEVAGKAYEAIPIKPDTPAAIASSVAALRELTQIFESNPRMEFLFRNTKLNGYLSALEHDRGGTGLSWEDLKQFRSRIGEEIGEQRFSDSPTKGELRRLYAALSQDMHITAQQQGPKALAAFDRANSIYRQGQQRIDSAVKYLVGDDGAMTAEKAAARIQAMVKSGKASSDLSRMAEIRKSLPSEEAGELVNGVIKLLGQPANSEGRNFSAETFTRNFKDMVPEAKNLLFGGANKELRQNLDEFAKVMGDVAGSNATRNTSNTAMGLAGLIGFGTAGAPGLIGQAATSYGLAKLWTNPKFVRWATGYSKMVRAADKAGVADPGKLRTQASLLQKLAASDPAIAQDVLPLRDAILKAVNDNSPARVAASDQEKQKGD